MGAGEPVLTTRVGGVVSAEECGVSGLLVSSGKLGELVEAMNRLAAQSSLVQAWVDQEKRK